MIFVVHKTMNELGVLEERGFEDLPSLTKNERVLRMEEEVLGVFSRTEKTFSGKATVLLELAASDDLIGFKQTVEDDGLAIDRSGLWYGRSSWGRMQPLERTPLMIAALFGSIDVLKYILSTYSTCGIDVNSASGSDGATALHCTASDSSPRILQVVNLLMEASGNINSVDAVGNRHGEMIMGSSPLLYDAMNELRFLLNVNSDGRLSLVARMPKSCGERKEYPIDLSMPDIKKWVVQHR